MRDPGDFLVDALRWLLEEELGVPHAAGGLWRGDLPMGAMAGALRRAGIQIHAPVIANVRAAIFVTPEVAEDGVDRGVYTYADDVRTAAAAQHAQVMVANGAMINGMEIPTEERYVCVMCDVV